MVGSQPGPGADRAADGLLSLLPPGTDSPAEAGRARGLGSGDPGAWQSWPC